MKFKKLLAILLVVVMTASMAACGGGSGSSGSGGSGSAGGETGSDGTTRYTDNDEAFTVVMGYIGDERADEALVEAEINKILEPALNAKIDLRCYGWGDYTQKIQLALSGNEQLDIVPIIVQNAQGYVSNGQVMDLSTLIEDYGTNIKKYVDPDFLACPNIEGFVYGVTSMREQITWEGAVVRRDLLEEAGYTVNDATDICEEITNLEQFSEAMAKVYEKHSDMIMMGSAANSSPLFRWETSDLLTDGFGALMDFGQSTEVVNLYETDEFRDFVTLMKDWNDKGYFSKDAATTTDSLQVQMKAGKIFGYMTPLKAGAVTQDELSTGQDLAGISLYGDPYITSYSINFLTWGIGRNCKNPARTMKVLDYIYGSADVMNLLNWGIEGTHYKFVDEEAGIITFADGQDQANPGWMLNIGWELPNQEIAYTVEPDTKEKWTYQHELIDKATRSKALGFAYDSNAVSNELTALANVKSQYYDTLGTGAVEDVDAAIAEFNAALESAGLKTVMAAKQEQLDKWLAEQGNAGTAETTGETAAK